MKSVYLESTIPSYLASRPSRDLIVAAHQQITHQWWETRRYNFRLTISDAVLTEIQLGDPELAARRLRIVDALPVLRTNESIDELSRIYEANLRLPREAATDITHIALAVGFRIDYLLTWNCRHIANGFVIERLRTINERMNLKSPIILTPEELLYEERRERDTL